MIAGFVKAAPSGDLDQVNGPQEKARRPLDRKSAGFQSSLRRGKESLLWPLCLQWSGEGFPSCGWESFVSHPGCKLHWALVMALSTGYCP